MSTSPTAASSGAGLPAVALLLDLENLLHDARHVSGEAVRAALEELVSLTSGLGERRHAVATCDWWLARIVCPVAANLRLRVYPGPSGRDRADRELLVRARDFPAAVDTVVIGSGDHIFAPVARSQRRLGRRVVVVARPGSLARALREAADEVIHFEPAGAVAAAA